MCKPSYMTIYLAMVPYRHRNTRPLAQAKLSALGEIAIKHTEVFDKHMADVQNFVLKQARAYSSLRFTVPGLLSSSVHTYPAVMPGDHHHLCLGGGRAASAPGQGATWRVVAAGPGEQEQEADGPRHQVARGQGPDRTPCTPQIPYKKTGSDLYKKWVLTRTIEWRNG